MIGGVVKIPCIYIEVCEYSISIQQLTDADECSPPSGPSGFPLPGTDVQIYSNISLWTSNDIDYIEHESALSIAIHHPCRHPHTGLLRGTPRTAQMARISLYTGTLLLTTGIQIVCSGRWMILKPREGKPHQSMADDWWRY
jgi:hypothetical protein